ncbi:MAG: hypothetical protein L0206_14795 [Actinobacteria bacterium]|nr:hypothetical protein [Actinomycetota bacterium]
MSWPWIVALLALWALTVGLALMMMGLLRRVSGVIEAAEQRIRAPSALGGLPVGSVVPPFDVKDEDGANVSSSALLTRPTVFLMLSPDCAPCRALIEELRSPDRPVGDMPIVAVVQGDRKPDFDLSGALPLFYDRTAFRAFDNTTTPFAYAVDTEATVVAIGVADSIDSLRSLADTLREEEVVRVE